MIVQLKDNVTNDEINVILQAIETIGYKSSEVKTQKGHYLVAIGSKDFDIRTIGHLPGITDVYRVSDTYKLVSRKWKVESTTISIDKDVAIGKDFCFMMGPCSIEDDKQIESTIAHLKQNNIKVMRGGVFKPRTSPYSFRGVGIEGLKVWSQIAKEHNIKIISEILAVDQIENMYPYVDIYQVGTRNSQNFTLLHELGNVDKPVLIKRGMSGTLEELLHSAEYIFSNGNEKLILCERGIRTFETAYRNTLDLNAIPVLKEKTHLPVIVDPSHGIGIRRFITQMAMASAVVGADGLLLEIHEQPYQAFSDAQQTLSYTESTDLIQKVRNCLASIK